MLVQNRAEERKRQSEAMPAAEPELKHRAPFTPPRKALIAEQSSKNSDAESKESDIEDDVDDEDYAESLQTMMIRFCRSRLRRHHA